MKSTFFRNGRWLFLAPVSLFLFFFIVRLFPSRSIASRSECQSNLAQIYLATMAYTHDFDGKFPPTGTSQLKASSGSPKTRPLNPPAGWADVVGVWNKSDTIFICYAEPTPQNQWRNPALNHYTDFWMNRNLSNAQVSGLTFPSSTLLVGEGNDGEDKTDGAYAKSTFPARWLTDESSPASRHRGGANYLMTDGTIRWLKPDKVMTYGGRKDSFSLR